MADQTEPEFNPEAPAEWIAWFASDFRKRNPGSDSAAYLSELVDSDPGRIRMAELFFQGAKSESIALVHSAIGRPGTREAATLEEVPEGIAVDDISPAVRAVLGLLSREGNGSSSPAPTTSTSSPAPSRQKKSGPRAGDPLSF